MEKLLSISQLAELLEMGYAACNKRYQRGGFQTAVLLTREQVENMGFEWGGATGGIRGNSSRPYISISDPAIPDHVRRRHLSERSGSPSSPGDQREGSSKLLHSCSPRPGSDVSEFSRAAAQHTLCIPPDTTTKRLSGTAIKLPGGASLKTRGGDEGPFPGDSHDLDMYRALPDWARRQVDKYLPMVLRTEGMGQDEILREVLKWNAEHPELAMSSRSLRLAKRRYRKRGVAGLASRRGGRSGDTIVRAEWLAYFKSLYLKEGGPSAESCWLITRGKFPHADPWPACSTFVYQLRRQVPADAIFMARHGEGAWNRKYGRYIERDYSNILCGEVWVSDHAQIDVAVAEEDGKPFFPWITAWRCMKSGKWLGWLLHREAPNSDHVFQSFYYACRDFGIPKHIYIDNGKDYRVRDFAGGRTKRGKLKMDETRARSICAILGIEVHFALPYNAQAKNIERDFNSVKESFSKHMPGYRGGHSKERPEALAMEIKRGRILGSGDFAGTLGAHIAYNINRAPGTGKNLRGLCPDELYEREEANRFVAPEALSLLCMRVSRARKIGRNGVRDSRSRINYFAEWMFGQQERKVYLRRDPSDMETAWVFDAETDEYLGRGERVEGVPAIAVGDEERELLSTAMAAKRTARKIARAYASDVTEIPPLEKVANMAAGNARASGYSPAENKKKKDYKEYPLSSAVISKERRLAQDGAADYSAVAPPRREKPVRIYMSQADREREEAEQKLLEEELRHAGT